MTMNASSGVATAPQRAARETETTIYTARGTWLVMIVPLILCGLWLIFTLFAVLSKVPAAIAIVGGIQLLLALRCLWLYLVWKSTTLSVTTRRLQGRQGVISRSDISLLHDKIESFSVHQGLFGRMLGFGTINVAGSGQGRVSFTGIANPIELRRAIEDAVEDSRSRGR